MRTPKPKMTDKNIAYLMSILIETQMSGVIRLHSLGMISTEKEVFTACHELLTAFEYKLKEIDKNGK